MMSWWQIALVCGLVAPWTFQGTYLRLAFSRSLTVGLGAWLGTATLPILLMLGVMWAGQKLVNPEPSPQQIEFRREAVRRGIALDRVFEGRCSDNCSGHAAGYEWAFDQGLRDADRCHNDSRSFEEGCRVGVRDFRLLKP